MLKRGIKKYAGWVMSFLVCCCQGTPDVELYTVESVAPDIVEPKETLIIGGDGFVEGEVRVVISGEFKPIGLKPFFRKRVVLEGTAVSPVRIEVPMTDYAMKKIGEELLFFDGMVTVAFPQVQTNASLSLESSSPRVQLEFRPEGGGIKARALKERESRTILSMLGLETVVPSDGDTIEIHRVTPGSDAARRGIVAGYLLVAVDGFPLSRTADLAGLDLSEPHLFEFVSPDGETRTLELNPTDTRLFEKDEFWTVALTAVVLGFITALMVSPRRHRDQPVSEKKPIINGAGMFLMTVLSIIAGAGVIYYQMGVTGTLILTSVYVSGTVLLGMGSPQHSIARGVNALSAVIAVAGIVTMGSVAGNDPGLWNAVSEQGDAGFSLNIWKNPLMTAAVGLGVYLLWPTELLAQSRRFGISLLAWLNCGTGAVLVVFFFLGGWHIPGIDLGTPGTTTEILLAISLFVGKTWLVVTAARMMARADWLERRRNEKPAGFLQLWWSVYIPLVVMAIVLEMIDCPADVVFAGRVISAGGFFFMTAFFVAARRLSRSVTA